MNKYLGHPYQLSGVLEYKLTGGKADGMRMLRVRNGLGLDFEVSLDRCADISTLTVGGYNMGYFAPSGYVHPSYYVGRGAEFLKSFTAGFFTTCGLVAVGSPCVDEGEELPLHGNISNTPSEYHAYTESDDYIEISAKIRDASLFSHQLLINRTYKISKRKNEITLTDVIENVGSSESPLLLLYHCNMGYPLLSENSIVVIDANKVTPRNAHAAEDTENCLKMEKPQSGYEERCYYHDIKVKDGVAKCGIFSPDIEKGLVMCYNKDTLDYFTEWKMMGEVEYVLGLEPGNCTPDGRDVLRREGRLKFIKPGESYKTQITFTFTNSEKDFKENL